MWRRGNMLQSAHTDPRKDWRRKTKSRGQWRWFWLECPGDWSFVSSHRFYMYWVPKRVFQFSHIEINVANNSSVLWGLAFHPVYSKLLIATRNLDKHLIVDCMLNWRWKSYYIFLCSLWKCTAKWVVKGGTAQSNVSWYLCMSSGSCPWYFE